MTTATTTTIPNAVEAARGSIEKGITPSMRKQLYDLITHRMNHGEFWLKIEIPEAERAITSRSLAALGYNVDPLDEKTIVFSWYDPVKLTWDPSPAFIPATVANETALLVTKGAKLSEEDAKYICKMIDSSQSYGIFSASMLFDCRENCHIITQVLKTRGYAVQHDGVDGRQIKYKLHVYWGTPQ